MNEIPTSKTPSLRNAPVLQPFQQPPSQEPPGQASQKEPVSYSQGSSNFVPAKKPPAAPDEAGHFKAKLAGRERPKEAPADTTKAPAACGSSAPVGEDETAAALQRAAQKLTSDPTQAIWDMQVILADCIGVTAKANLVQTLARTAAELSETLDKAKDHVMLPLIGLVAPDAISKLERDLEIVRNTLDKVFKSDAAGIVQELHRNGDLTDTLELMIRPVTGEPREELNARRKDLMSIAKKLSGDPEAAAKLMMGVTQAVLRIAGTEDIGLAVAEGLKSKLGLDLGPLDVELELDPKPIVDALRRKHQTDLAEFYDEFCQMFRSHTEEAWGTNDKKSPQWRKFHQTQQHWARAIGALRPPQPEASAR